MPAMQGLGWTFDTVASAYEKWRPGYVEPLYQAIFDYMPLDASSRAVEVGIGGGQATEPVSYTHLDVYKRQGAFHGIDIEHLVSGQGDGQMGGFVKFLA